MPKNELEKGVGGGEYPFQATMNKNNFTNRTTDPGEVTDYNYLHNTTVVPRVYARVCRITVNKRRKNTSRFSQLVNPFANLQDQVLNTLWCGGVASGYYTYIGNFTLL